VVDKATGQIVRIFFACGKDALFQPFQKIKNGF